MKTEISKTLPTSPLLAPILSHIDLTHNPSNLLLCDCFNAVYESTASYLKCFLSFGFEFCPTPPVCLPNYIVIETSNTNKAQYVRITATETDFLTAVAKRKRLDYKRIGNIKNLSNISNITHRI